MSFDFFPNEQGAALQNATRHPSATPEPGIWSNFSSGTGQYAVRSLAEAGRAVSMAGAVVPIIADKLTAGDNFSGETMADGYFRAHDEYFNRAVDHWTPKPGEVGTAGQVAGQLAGGIMQAVISPALLVGTAQLSSAEELVRNGVDATTANAVGAVQGASMAVGVKMPFLGQSLATRVLSGAGGNVVQGVAGAAASSELLKAKGYSAQAEQYNPWDLRARALDVMLGAAFGGMAHIEAKLTATDQAALLVANQARHMEDATPQGRPATDVDATQHVDAMRQSIDQVLRGEPVTVDGITKDMRTVPDDTQHQQRTEVVDEAYRLAVQEAPDGQPIATPNDPALVRAQAPEVGSDAAATQARRIAQEQPDLMIPTDRTDAQGNPMTMRAADAINQATAKVNHATTNATSLFQAAAHCLLGAL